MGRGLLSWAAFPFGRDGFRRWFELGHQIRDPHDGNDASVIIRLLLCVLVAGPAEILLRCEDFTFLIDPHLAFKNQSLSQRSMMDGMGEMMWGAGLLWFLLIVVLVLAAAALIKYLRSGGTR